MLAEKVAAAARNANLSETTGVDSKTTGVHRETIISDDRADDSNAGDIPQKMEEDSGSDNSNNEGLCRHSYE